MTMYGSDAFSPAEIAEKVEKVGVAKAKLPLLQTILLCLPALSSVLAPCISCW